MKKLKRRVFSLGFALKHCFFSLLVKEGIFIDDVLPDVSGLVSRAELTEDFPLLNLQTCLKALVALDTPACLGESTPE